MSGFYIAYVFKIRIYHFVRECNVLKGRKKMKKILIFIGCVAPAIFITGIAKDRPPKIHSREDVLKLINPEQKALVKLSKEEINKNINSITSSMNAIKEMSPSGQEVVSKQTKKELKNINEGLGEIKKRIVSTLEQKPIKDFKPKTSLNAIQKQMNGMLKGIKTMSPEARTKALNSLATSMKNFQDHVKDALPSDIFIRLTSLQGKLDVLAQSKVPSTDKGAFAHIVKKEVAHLKKHITPLENLGLANEAKALKENIKAFIDSKELDAAKLKEQAALVFEKAKDAYTKAVGK